MSVNPPQDPRQLTPSSSSSASDSAVDFPVSPALVASLIADLRGGTVPAFADQAIKHFTIAPDDSAVLLTLANGLRAHVRPSRAHLTEAQEQRLHEAQTRAERHGSDYAGELASEALDDAQRALARYLRLHFTQIEGQAVIRQTCYCGDCEEIRMALASIRSVAERQRD